jgi:hypothetical protein
MDSQPSERLLTRSVQEKPPLLEEEDTAAELERARRSVLREDNCGTELLDMAEKLVRARRIELRGRLVEEEKPRAERKRGREAHALQLTPRELHRLPPGQMKGPYDRERIVRARPDLRSWDAEVLEPESGLVGDAGHDDLVLRILEDRGNGPREIRGASAARVVPGDLDAAAEAAAVEVRNKSSERAQEGRLP